MCKAAKVLNWVLLMVCCLASGLAGQEQTTFTVDVTPGGPIGVSKFENAPANQELKFVVNARNGLFVEKTGKILSSKNHSGATWTAVASENKAEHFWARLPRLGTDKSTQVLCSGQWANPLVNGGNGNNTNVTKNWLAELVGKDQVRVFLCHQYPNDPMTNKAILIGAQYTGELCGTIDRDCIVIKVGAGNETANITNISSALSQKKVKENSVTALYSVGHGAIGYLCAGYTNPADVQRIVCAGSNLNNAVPSCDCATYVRQFEKYLMKGQATVYLHHCHSGATASGASSMVDSVASALSNKFVVVGLTGRAETGDKGFAPSSRDNQSSYIFSTPNGQN